MRDITLEDTFRHQFTTRQFADGVPTTLLGTPVLSVLEENNATPITAGVSVSVDRASVAGLNEATVVATAANGYETLKSYSIYISTGTVGGVSVVGEVIGSFTIDKTAKAVWDRVLTGATHNVVDSGGRRLRDLQEFGTYEGGAIWIDTVNGTAGTNDFESGTNFHPVDSIADATTLATSLGITRFQLAPNSTITLPQTYNNFVFMGNGWTLALDGRDVGGTIFKGATVSGTGTGSADITFEDCVLGTCTLNPTHAIRCGLTATITFGLAGDYVFDDCHSAIAGSITPIIDTGAAIANVNLAMPDYHNGIEIQNLNNLVSDTFSISGIGQIIYAASSSGSVNQRGDWKVTNTGGVTITADDNTTNLDTITGADGATVASAQGPVTFTGVSNEAGITLAGEGTGPGLSTTGGLTGHGIESIGGATSGDGINSAANGSGKGMDIIGVGANAGLRTEGGATGPGIHVHGGATGATPGMEVHAHSASGDALELNVDGSGVSNADLAAILADTNELQSDDVPGLIAALNDIAASDILTTALTESYAADGVAPTLAQAIFMIQQQAGEFAVISTTLTVKKLDGSTTAATFTLDDATNPTSRTRAT